MADRTNCSLCGWISADWPLTDMARCEASWHVYETHPEQWRQAVGSDRLPVDPDPRKGLGPWYHMRLDPLWEAIERMLK